MGTHLNAFPLRDRGRRLNAGDLQCFDEEFGHWFKIDADPEKGVVRLTLRDSDPVETFEQVRFPADSIDDFLNRFRAFAWRVTLGAEVIPPSVWA